MDDYILTILESCDDVTQQELKELLDEGLSIEEAVEELEQEGLLW